MWGSRAPAKRGDGTSAGLIVGSEVLGVERSWATATDASEVASENVLVRPLWK